MSRGIMMVARISAVVGIGLATVASAAGPEIDEAEARYRAATLPRLDFSAGLVPGARIATLRTMLEIERVRRETAQLEADIAELDPGEYVWRPERRTEGAVEMVVSLETQLVYVYRGGMLIGASTVSTGARPGSTPTGSFEILQKAREHYSNLYNNAPMPNMQRLTWDGIALHAGVIPGYPASHGCVRLPTRFSELLFAATRMNERVHIVAGAPPSADGALRFATAAPARGGGVELASAR